jgi:hypothetical protein
MPNIDDILKPDNLNNSKKSALDTTKSKLANLKELIKSDPVQLNTNDLFPKIGDFPDNSNSIKYIDYIDEMKNHKEFAEQSVNNIVLTYVKSLSLLDSPRLKDLKQNDILKYSRILLMLSISESNLLRLQESIDGGDMSKEMFDSVNKAQQELRANMKVLDEHLNKCESYWKIYAELYGFENEEEKIVKQTEEKIDDADKRVIVDMSKLTDLIHAKQEQLKKEEETKKNIVEQEYQKNKNKKED